MLTAISDLAGGKKATGLVVDIRSRNADGELMYPDQYQEPVITKLKRVYWKRKKDKREGRFYRWLRWEWEPVHNTYCDYSGAREDLARKYYLEVMD